MPFLLYSLNKYVNCFTKNALILSLRLIKNLISRDFNGIIFYSYEINLSLCRSMIRIFSQISDFSSAAKRLGTSPELRRLLMSSRKPSSLICVSMKRKTVCRSLAALFRRMFFKSSCHSCIPYSWDICTWKSS